MSEELNWGQVVRLRVFVYVLDHPTLK